MHDMSAVFINEYDKVEEPLPDFYVHDVSLPAFIGPFGMFRPGVMYSLCYLDTDEREYIVLRGYNGGGLSMYKYRSHMEKIHEQLKSVCGVVPIVLC